VPGAHGRAPESASLLLDHPLRSTAVGGLLGAVVVTALLAAGFHARHARHAGHPRPAPPTLTAASRFVAAWHAHLSTSWSVDEIERRTTTSGATISFQIHEAQRPPDSVSSGGTTVSARRGETLIACATALGSSTPVCREQTTTQTWDQGVAVQIAQLTAAVTGPSAPYTVTDLGGACYSLTLRPATAPLPTFIDRGARYCFDPATNAVRMSVIQRTGAVDTTIATVMRAPATDADLALPAHARYEQG
jgi:hypothetical protein